MKKIIVYLDQNHWISLAKANTQHPQGSTFIDVLFYLKKAVADGQIVCPLSLTHYMELSYIGNFKQRSDVAEVMAELSLFYTLPPKDILQKIEMKRALLNAFRHHENKKIDTKNILGRGCFFAGNGEEKTVGFDGYMFDTVPMQPDLDLREKLLPWASGIRLILENELLRGPRDNEVSLLREKYGYRPEASRLVAIKRATQEDELAELLSKNPKEKKRLSNIVAARYLYWEMFDDLHDLLLELKIDRDEFIAVGIEGITKIVKDIPTANVATTILELNFKNINRPWQKNDIHDLDALVVSVPYCNIIATDKHNATQLNRNNVDEIFQCSITSNLLEIPNLVEIIKASLN